MTMPEQSSSHEQILNLVDAIVAVDIKKEGSHQELLSRSQELVEALQFPFQRAFDFMFQFAVPPCARIAVDLGIFPLLEPGPQTAAQLAEKTKADVLLIVRIMRVLTSAHICKLLEHGRYGATPLSSVFCLPTLSDGLKHTFDMGYRPSAKLPDYFRENGYTNPEDSLHGPFQYAFDTKLDFFAWLEDHQREAKQFNSLMSNYRAAKPRWVDIFPAEDAVFKHIDIKETSPVIVDIGGGYGHDLDIFLRKFPKTKGKAVLQDLSSVVSSVPTGTSSGIQVMPHDFFTAQPVKGARVYFLKSVLHDWPKPKALEILRNIVPAMEEGYSKLLIAENVLPPAEVPLDTAGLDITLMVNFSSLERTEEQWSDLLAGAGLRMTNVWRQPSGDAVIEAQL